MKTKEMKCDRCKKEISEMKHKQTFRRMTGIYCWDCIPKIKINPFMIGVHDIWTCPCGFTTKVYIYKTKRGRAVDTFGAMGRMTKHKKTCKWDIGNKGGIKLD